MRYKILRFFYFVCAKHKICFSFTFQFSVFGFLFLI
nr:MAG TPA: hypothetical protein [Caudoviricetes sp.]